MRLTDCQYVAQITHWLLVRRDERSAPVVQLIENLGGAYIVGTELKLTLALIIIVSVLTVRPSGLMGRTVQSRV